MEPINPLDEIQQRINAGEHSAVLRAIAHLNLKIEANTEADRLRMERIDQRAKQGYIALNQRTWFMFGALGVLAALLWRLDLSTEQGAAIANTLIEQSVAVLPVILPILVGAGYWKSQQGGEDAK